MINKEKDKNKAGFNWRIPAIYLCAAILVVAVIAMIWIGNDRLANTPEETQGSEGNLNVQIEPVQDQVRDLGNDLELVSVGKFAGIYMEDGSDEVVSNLLMVQVKNNSQKDLQFAKIRLEYAAFTAEFEVSNIPAGRSVVLLEKNRRAYVEDEFVSVSAQNVVFFQEQMSVQSEKFKISGLEGALNVTNISGEDISGTVYIYYKYTSRDHLYGGITFRAKIDNGIKAGELKQIMTSHYDPDTCEILAVEFGE